MPKFSLKFSQIFSIIFLLVLVIVGLIIGRNRRSNQNYYQAGMGSFESFDCLQNNCPEITIENDNPSSLSGRQVGFFGFADPSIQKDITSDVIWLTYSWPNIHFNPDAKKKIIPAIDLHLAKSIDGGKSWDFQSVLWESSAMIHPISRVEGFIDKEVIDIEQVEISNQVKWVSAHLEYFVPKDEGRSGKDLSSFLISVAVSDQLATLPIAETQRLGSEKTSEKWQIDLHLTDLNPQLEKCSIWNEPALLHYDGRLYLGLRCLSFTNVGNRPDMQESDYAIFSVIPTADILDWDWQYEGMLDSDTVAPYLGGASLTQMDLTVSEDQILAVVTPDDWNSQLKDFVHYGCRVIELESLSPPQFAYDADGEVVVHESIIASDQGELGPGACAYEPESNTGVLFTKRTIGETFLEASIHETGLMP